DAFASATTALDQVKRPLRNDLRAVERTYGLRMTEHGAISRDAPTSLAAVNDWVDGDTVDTSAGRVRVIGINTPELDEQCGPARAAKDAATQLAPAGQRVRLVNPESVQDQDRYGRLLRYVDVAPAASGLATVDVGYSLLLNDLAEPRYDSRDGYQWHPREAAYRETRAKPAVASGSGCTMPEERGLLALASVLAAEKGEDEFSRSKILDDLIPHPHASAVKTLAGSVSAVARADAKSDAARARAHAAARARTKRVQERQRQRAAAARESAHTSPKGASTKSNASKSSNPAKKSQSPKKTKKTKKSAGSGNNYPGYRGPRCYAPGGKTWKPCHSK
ncbi:MAG: thermonuclease family protein, partial [Janthinobacterium lividum]